MFLNFINFYTSAHNKKVPMEVLKLTPRQPYVHQCSLNAKDYIIVWMTTINIFYYLIVSTSTLRV